MPVSGRHIERCLTGSSLRLFNLLYCKYLIPPRCLLAISGRINRRGARQKGQNEYLRLSDMPPPAFSSHWDVAGLTHRATWSNVFAATMLALTFLNYRHETLLSSYFNYPPVLCSLFHDLNTQVQARRLTHLFRKYMFLQLLYFQIDMHID